MTRRLVVSSSDFRLFPFKTNLMSSDLFIYCVICGMEGLVVYVIDTMVNILGKVLN